MTTTQAMSRTITVRSLDFEGDEVTEQIDPSLFNYELLGQLGRWARQDDEFAQWGKWYQGLWAQFEGLVPRGGRDFFSGSEFTGVKPNVCGTAFCMAGQAVVQAGYRLLYSGDSGYRVAENCVLTEPTGEVDEKGRAIYSDVGNRVTIPDAAQATLGISDLETELFNGDNCIDYILGRINGMCLQRNLPLLFPEAEVYECSHEYLKGDDGAEHDCL